MQKSQTTTLSLLGKELGQFLVICALAYGLYLLTQHYWNDALSMLAGSAAVLVGMVLIKRNLAIAITGLVMGVLGPMFEIQAVRSGAWSFAGPHLEGIPAWLFLVWAIFGVFIASFYEFLRILIAQTESVRNPPTEEEVIADALDEDTPA